LICPLLGPYRRVLQGAAGFKCKERQTSTDNQLTHPAYIVLPPQSVMTCNHRIAYFLFIAAVVLSGCVVSSGKFVVHSQTTLDIELIGYNGLNETAIFTGNLAPGTRQEIQSPYRGLALLAFTSGQQYPVIIGDNSFTVKIVGPSQPPSFKNSAENDFFYKMLAGDDAPSGEYDFPRLMIQAKSLLESSYSIHTTEELTTKKKEFHELVDQHYEKLKHSDMIRRLIAQYFMMHEYVDYHREGAPVSDIRDRYQKEVVDGVRSWLKILKSQLSEQEILNYCVSLYYDRSMITFASLIIDNFREAAFCPGDEQKRFSFPADMQIVRADRDKERKFSDFKGNKVIAFVSEECPVSMVETISKARQLATQNEDVPMIVAPLEKLSKKHLAMSRMIRNGNMFFVENEKWRQGNLATKIRLPLFVQVRD